jgi:hypothetical protein
LGQSACIDGANFNAGSPSFACCDACHTITVAGSSASFCCPDDQVPFFTGTGVTCAAADACPILSGTAITPTECGSGTTCSTFTDSGFTIGQCCPSGQSAGIDAASPTSVICCASPCGTAPPACCTAGESCVSNNCTPNG